VLARVDESTYGGDTMGADHAIAWSGRYGEGHTWHIALGHASEGPTPRPRSPCLPPRGAASVLQLAEAPSRARVA